MQKLRIAFLTSLMACAVWFTPTAKADEWDKLTVFTFQEPVEIPGQVLPAGTYVFKLLDSPGDRNIVQIFTEDQKQLVATIMAIPNYRLDPTGKTVMTFEERAAGSPQALHAWFYPGDNFGFEFVYPKVETPIVAQTAEPAPAAPAPEPQQAAAEQPVVEQPVEQTKEEQVVVREEEVIIAEVTPPAAPSPPAELPKTAGNFAIIPLLGIALLGGGFTALRFATKQS